MLAALRERSVLQPSSVSYGESSRYRNAVLADAPRGYWRLGEPSGTAILDTSGNGQNGLYKNTPTLGEAGALSGDSNTAVAFNGTDEYGEVPHNGLLNHGDVFSYELWFKQTEKLERCLLFKQGTSGTTAKVDINSELKPRLRVPGFANLVVSSVAVEDTNWHHLVVTKTGSTIKLYLDGVDRTGSTENRSITDNTGPVYIGTEEPGGGFFKGTLDEVAWYGYALSEARVVAHYEAAQEAVAAGLPAGSLNLLGVGR